MPGDGREDDTVARVVANRRHECSRVASGALSSDEKVFHVGLMLSRGEDAVRLCIRLRSVERIMEYSTVVGWPGDEADLRKASSSR